MGKAQVAIARDVDPVEMTKAALELAGIGELCRGKEVLLKANLSGGAPESPGAIISEEVTRGVLKYLKPFCKRLVLGEGGRTPERIRELIEEKTFTRRLCDELGVEVINFWHSETVTVPVPKPVARKEWMVHKAILDFEVVGTLAALKVNSGATVTMGIKNLFSCIAYEKLYRLHPWLQEVLVDIAQIVRPAFGVVDGLFGWEGGEASLGNGRTVESNVVLAGKDIVALDAVGAMVIGRDPLQIKKLRLAHEVGLGVHDPAEIEILGLPIEQVRMNFEDVPAEQKTRPKQETLDAGIDAMLARP